MAQVSKSKTHTLYPRSYNKIGNWFHSHIFEEVKKVATERDLTLSTYMPIEATQITSAIFSIAFFAKGGKQNYMLLNMNLASKHEQKERQYNSIW